MNLPDNHFDADEILREGIIVRSSLDAIITMDAQGRVIEFNPAAERIFGIARAQIKGRDLADVIIPVDLRERHRAGLRHYLETGEHKVLEKRIEIKAVRANGEVFPVELSVTPYELGGERLFTAFLRDITRRKADEAALRRAKNEAEQATLSKTEFLANMSHELRTPLNAIMGFSDFIRTEMFGSIEQQRYVTYADLINSSGQHLLDLINDLLDMSRIEAGKVQIRPSVLELEDVIKACFLFVESSAHDRGLTLSQDITKGATQIWADDRALRQVLINLLSNAVKFSHEGGSIRLSARRLNDSVEVCIADDGIGIEGEFMPRLTQPFERSSSSLVASHSGTGLGLSIVKALMDLHAGSIEIDSTEGEGTEVRVTFPDYVAL